MSRIFGATFDSARLFGLIFIAALALFGVWRVIDYYRPDKDQPLTKYEYIQDQNTRMAEAERMKRIADSVEAAEHRRLQDSFYTAQMHRDDSIANIQLNQIQEQNEITNKIRRASTADNISWWEQNFGAR